MWNRRMAAAAAGLLLFLRTSVCELKSQDSRRDATFRVPVRLVTIPTLVLSTDGRSISGLEAVHFQLLDNGRPQVFTLDVEMRRESVALVVQRNRDVREYLPQLVKAGNLISASLSPSEGSLALVAYNDTVSICKPFEKDDAASALKQLSAEGTDARLIDAGLIAVDLLSKRPSSELKAVVFVGQPFDRGSEGTLDDLKTRAGNEAISIFALTLPLAGKSFVSDTFSLGPSNKTPGKGGFQAGVELTTLIPALRHAGKVQSGNDPFSVLTAATGGTEIPWRKQQQPEDAVLAAGTDLRSYYLLTYIPASTEAGHHEVSVKVNIPSTKVRFRSGYERN